jgi:hypothetical protein
VSDTAEAAGSSMASPSHQADPRRSHFSRANGDDGLPLTSLRRIERGDGIVERRKGANIRAESPIPDALGDLAQLRTVRLDGEIDREAIVGARVNRCSGHLLTARPTAAFGAGAQDRLHKRAHYPGEIAPPLIQPQTRTKRHCVSCAKADDQC